MRKIKSAPANLCEMKHNIISKLNKEQEQEKEKKQENVIIIKNNIIDSNKLSINDKRYQIQSNKKTKNRIISILSDSLYETNKIFPETYNYNMNILFEFISNFMNNKITKVNLENFLISIMIRVIIGHGYHDILVKVKENINTLIN